MIRIFSHYVSKTGFLLLLLEIAVLHAAAVVTSALWMVEVGPPAPTGRVYLFSLVYALVMVLSMSAMGMYQHRSHDDLRASLLRLMPAFALGFGLLKLVVYLMPTLSFSHGSLNVIVALGCSGVLLMRLAVFGSAHTAMLESRLILIGAGSLAQECIDLANSPLGAHKFTVVGCIDVVGEPRCVPAAAMLPADPSLLETARRYDAQEIVVSVTDRRNGAFPVRQLLDCALGGIRVIDAATFFEREACQIRIDTLQPSYLIYGGGFDQSFTRAASKRLFDLLASAAIFLAALPVMLVTALWIRLDDGGPVFYRQERVGKHGRRFQVLKFRSMRSDAERDGTPVWASTNDPRVTRIGQIIRKLRIDELPQMVNVFKGEMSFVGPRPERGFFVEQLNKDVAYYHVRHGIKPGITGLAQVRYQYGASVGDAVKKLQYDLYYVKNNSLFLDLLILLDTVQVVLFGKGSR